MPGRLKVHVLFEHAADMKPYGSSYIRLLLPLTHPANDDILEVTYGPDYRHADLLIIDRLWRPGDSIDIARALIRKARRDGAKIVHFVDDNILDLEKKPPLNNWPSIEAKLILRYFIRKADGVVVATPALKERLSLLNSRIIVVPNAVDERLFFQEPAPRSGHERSRKFTIGYMGTRSHDEDLLTVLKPLRALLASRRYTVEFQIAGGVADKCLIGLFDDLPARELKVDVADIEYPRFVGWMRRNLRWDLAIAPLVEDAFTRCKSDIKFLDYAALGIPGIYSDVTAYRDSVVHRKTGYLVENTSAAWTQALEELIADKRLRSEITASAKDYVKSQRTLAIGARRWPEALIELAS